MYYARTASGKLALFISNGKGVTRRHIVADIAEGECLVRRLSSTF